MPWAAKNAAARSQKGGGRFLLFVVEDFGVREPGVVIDGMMQVGITGPGTAVPLPLGASEGAVSAAVGDAPKLLDVHVDQVSGVLVLVALRCRCANGQTGALIQAGQPGHPVPGQDLADGGAGQAQVGRYPVRSPPPIEPQPHNAAFGAYGGAFRAPPRAGGRVSHAVLTTDPVAVHPLLGRRW